ncbi:hypothetical protein JJB99_01305 [Bradyrhizobium diazoefficiens]|uniref:hypothetical protein n=1 Tax=Bradyrhizobium diazoefficiens TaxID=1355477 RepID=UPI00190A94CC|nr:hypothetical protein [Bradyrhizobium diazoefficiens]QQO14862.1 hypothetical protein JJB99_01305 [Bradyrhizobium diazoefficiens]
MNSLDPSWLSIELEAIQKEQERWDQALKSSYAVAVARVLRYQGRTAEKSNIDEFAESAILHRQVP